MARPLRIEFPGALYHVTSRGNGKQKIFKNDSDRMLFLSIIEGIVQRYHFIVHAYCLMNNHYHLIIETPEGNLSEGMRQINGVYTQTYNRRNKKTGHVFQGRYKAIVVDKESYLLELVRYVSLNPVRARIVKEPEQWTWSSYRSTAGIDRCPPWLSVDWILGQFSMQKKKAQKLYMLFVSEGLTRESPWKNLEGQIFLGDKPFIEGLTGSFKESIKEIPRSQRYAGRPAMQEIFTKKCRTDKIKRNMAIAKATAYGYTLKEIADHLDIHYATVSRALKRK